MCAPAIITSQKMSFPLVQLGCKYKYNCSFNQLWPSNYCPFAPHDQFHQHLLVINSYVFYVSKQQNHSASGLIALVYLQGPHSHGQTLPALVLTLARVSNIKTKLAVKATFSRNDNVKLMSGRQLFRKAERNVPVSVSEEWKWFGKWLNECIIMLKVSGAVVRAPCETRTFAWTWTSLSLALSINLLFKV